MEILDSNRILEFKYVTLEDDGEYTCEASNRGGTDRRSITLSLLGKFPVNFKCTIFFVIGTKFMVMIVILDKPKGVNVGLVVGLLVLAVLLLVVIIYLCVRVRREQVSNYSRTQCLCV